MIYSKYNEYFTRNNTITKYEKYIESASIKNQNKYNYIDGTKYYNIEIQLVKQCFAQVFIPVGVALVKRRKNRDLYNIDAANVPKYIKQTKTQQQAKASIQQFMLYF